MSKKKYGYYESLLAISRKKWTLSNPKRKETLALVKKKIEGFEKYACAVCGGFYAYSDVAVDHIRPIANTKPSSLEEFIGCIQLLHSDNLQILCKPCHNIKTNIEKRDRAKKDSADIIAAHMQVETALVLKNVEDFAVLKKMEKLVAKLGATTGFKQNGYAKRFDKYVKQYF